MWKNTHWIELKKDEKQEEFVVRTTERNLIIELNYCIVITVLTQVEHLNV